MSKIENTLPTHHIQQELCTTRPIYRQGRKLTAVKVYTINNESQHLLIYRVPKINLSSELKEKCFKFGELKKIEPVTKYKTDDFTECYHVHYDRIQSARIAKRFLDNNSFYGEILHVCYAPEFETISETKSKLTQREKDVISRLQPGISMAEYANVQINTVKDRKKKYPALPITEKRLKIGQNDEIWNGIPLELDPRIADSSYSKVGFKKHFQIATATEKTVSFLNETQPVVQQKTVESCKTIATTTTTPCNNNNNNNNKRIIFRHKK